MSARKKMTFPERWVWIDLEMTGLDENNCAILQIAMIITDPSLNEITSTDLVIWQPESVLSEMIPFVRDMHTQNGLLKRVRSSTVSLAQAEAELMETLTHHVAYQRGILAGNSIYVDRKFLQKYMPAIEHHLHYRQIDVSSVKILCQEWYKQQSPKKPSSHTALEDIRQSIEELRYFKTHCFKD